MVSEIDSRTHTHTVRTMFARIAGVYDFMNHLLSLNLDRRWRRHLVDLVDSNVWEVLDLCAGTADLALACQRSGKGRQIVAADSCPEMLQVAANKPGAVALDLTVADALALPFPNESFDAVTVGFGIRNLADIEQGLVEMTRVLRPPGQILVLDFFRPDLRTELQIDQLVESQTAPRISPPSGVRTARRPNLRSATSTPREWRGPARPVRWWLDLWVPLLGRIFARDASAYTYLTTSRAGFLGCGELVCLLDELGYEEIRAVRQTLGIAHIVCGRKPL